MSVTRVTRAMVRDAAARAFPDGRWRVREDALTGRWNIARRGADGAWRVLSDGMTAREAWTALELVAAAGGMRDEAHETHETHETHDTGATDAPDTSNGGK